jgi:hypothetical protein
MKRVAIAASALAIAMSMGIGHADSVQGSTCVADGVTAVGGGCSSTFQLTSADATRKVSLLYTNANFYSATAVACGEGDPGPCYGSGGQGTAGTIDITWNDASGLVAQYSCPSVAFNADYQPLTVSRAQCTEVKAPRAFVPGDQTVTLAVSSIHTLPNFPAAGVRVMGGLNLISAGDIG